VIITGTTAASGCTPPCSTPSASTTGSCSPRRAASIAHADVVKTAQAPAFLDGLAAGPFDLPKGAPVQPPRIANSE
jgi:hypothetical protein